MEVTAGPNHTQKWGQHRALVGSIDFEISINLKFIEDTSKEEVESQEHESDQPDKPEYFQCKHPWSYSQHCCKRGRTSTLFTFADESELRNRDHSTLEPTHQQCLVGTKEKIKDI